MKPAGDIGTKTRTGLPLVKLNLAYPFIMELDRRGIDAESILNEHNLSRQMFSSPDLFVPAMVIYRLTEAAAGTAADPYLDVSVGESLDLYSWPPFVSAASKPSSIGDLFLNFATNANNLASSVEIQLHTEGDYTTFRSYRVFEPTFPPAQVDGFFVGIFVNMVCHATGDLWDSNEVTIRICDPNAIPKGYHNIMVSQGDNRGGSIQFPTHWLTKPFDLKSYSEPDKPLPTSLHTARREALTPYLHMRDLSIDRVAEICGYNARALGRKLRVEGTTITREIAKLKEEHATRALVESDRLIADIASSLGFHTPGVFTRSFTKWTGLSPRDYRKAHRKDKL